MKYMFNGYFCKLISRYKQKFSAVLLIDILKLIFLYLVNITHGVGRKISIMSNEVEY